MGNNNIYERFIWFDHNVRESKYPNATGLAEQFEVSVKTASLPFIYLSSEVLISGQQMY